MRISRRCGNTIIIPVEIAHAGNGQLINVNDAVIEATFSTGFNGQFSVTPLIEIPNQLTELGRFYVKLTPEMTANAFGSVYDLDIVVTFDGMRENLQKISIELTK